MVIADVAITNTIGTSTFRFESFPGPAAVVEAFVVGEIRCSSVSLLISSDLRHGTAAYMA